MGNSCPGCSAIEGDGVQKSSKSGLFCNNFSNVDAEETVTGNMASTGEDSMVGISASPILTSERVCLKFKESSAEHTLSTRPLGIRLGKDSHYTSVMVKSVTPDLPAAKSGIREGWQLSTVNGCAVESFASALDLEEAVCGPLDKHFLTLQSLLDVFDDFRPQVPLLKLYFESSALPDNEKARALAGKAAEIVKKPESVPEFLSEVVSNLKAVEPLSKNAEQACKLVIKYIDNWKFDTTGKVDSPPELSDKQEANLTLTLAELNAIHTLSYVHYPSKFNSYSTFLGISGALSRGTPKVQKPENPCAVITVGPPGSGKSYMISSEFGCLSYLKDNMRGPPARSYVEIDPDYWITNLCNNNNDYRPLCNMLNLESFFLSINQRYNIIFGGTGKDVKNTCGRVTSRLKQANYRIYYAIVLSTYENCKKRIRDRFEKTGRDVPDFVVKALFKGLQEAVPLYIKNQAQLCDALLIYENNTMGQKPTPLIVQGGRNEAQALELANRQLALPPE